MVYLLIYVDDIIIIGDNDGIMQKFILTLTNDFILRISSLSFIFLVLKSHTIVKGYFSLNVDILEIFQLTLACQMPNQSPHHLLQL